MPTGLHALELAIVAGLIFAAAVWWLGRKIPPDAGAADRSWRSAVWLSGPFGRPRLAPDGQPEPTPHTPSPNTFRRNQLAVLAAVIEVPLIAVLLRCWTGESRHPFGLPCTPPILWGIRVIACTVLIAWTVIDHRLNRGTRHHRHRRHGVR